VGTLVLLVLLPPERPRTPDIDVQRFDYQIREQSATGEALRHLQWRLDRIEEKLDWLLPVEE
jgi:hypothetical protein